MEIKPGMYVRTKYGIRQIYDINPNATRWKYLCKRKHQDGDGCIDLFELCDDDIFGDPSYDFTDLIEKDDYINGYRITYIAEGDACYDKKIHDKEFYIVDEETYFMKMYKEDIKTILTKEQYNASCVTIDML